MEQDLAPLDTADDFRALGEGLDELESLLARDPATLLEVRDGVSGWCAAEHAFHITLANELCLRNLTSLLEGKGMLVRPMEKRLPDALALLRGSRIPRGEAEAPRFVRPPSKIDPAVLADLFSGTRALYADLAPRVGELATTPNGIRHQVLGDLDATEWLRFARRHTRHHLDIAHEVLGAGGGTGADG